MALPHNALPPDLQAAIDADLSIEAMRGFVVLIATVSEMVNPQHLPFPGFDAIAALCQNLTRWVVVSNKHSPYAFVRGPITAADISICTFDLRVISEDGDRPQDVPPVVWPQVRNAVRRYREHHPLTAANDLLHAEPEGNA